MERDKKREKEKKGGGTKFSTVAVLFLEAIDRSMGRNTRPFDRVIARSRVQLGKICEYERGNRVGLLEEIRAVFNVTLRPTISHLFSFSQRYRGLCRLEARPERRAENTKTTTTSAVTMDELVSKCQMSQCDVSRVVVLTPDT